MKKKPKIKVKMADTITWTICPHCKKEVFGVTTMSIDMPAPSEMKR